MTNAQQGEQPGQLTVVSTATDGIRVLTLTGEIDHHTGDQLVRSLDFTDSPRPRVVLEMRGVTFMDSTGINILINAHRTVAEAGGWLRLAALTEPVQRIMSIVGVDAVIECRETLREALHL